MNQFPCSVKEILRQDGEELSLQHGNNLAPAYRCSECGYIYFDSPSDDYLAEFYSDEYPKSAASWYNYESDYSENKCRSRAKYLTEKYSEIMGVPPSTIHECGCSFGGTVAKLNEISFDATGTEYGATAVNAGRAGGNDKIFNESEDSFLKRTGRKIDLFYSFHALEHMPRPDMFLRDIRPYCSEHSLVIIHVPNSVSAYSIAKGYKNNPWFAYPGHLHLLSPRSVHCLATKTGFSVVEVRTNLLTDSTEKDAELFGNSIFGSENNLYDTTQDQMMGMELAFILTPVGTPGDRICEERIKNAKRRCIESGKLENWFLRIIAG